MLAHSRTVARTLPRGLCDDAAPGPRGGTGGCSNAGRRCVIQTWPCRWLIGQGAGGVARKHRQSATQDEQALRARIGTLCKMTVLLTVLFKSKNPKSNIHAGFKPSFGSCRANGNMGILRRLRMGHALTCPAPHAFDSQPLCAATGSLCSAKHTLTPRCRRPSDPARLGRCQGSGPPTGLRWRSRSCGR